MYPHRHGLEQHGLTANDGSHITSNPDIQGVRLALREVGCIARRYRLRNGVALHDQAGAKAKVTTPVALVSVPVKSIPMQVPAGINRSLSVVDSVSA